MSNEVESFKSPEEAEAAHEFNARSQESSLEDNSSDDIEAIYDTYPELSTIGSKEEYAAYLETIFPESRVKHICYRGTGDETEYVDKAGTNQSILKGAVFFTSDKKMADRYRRNITNIRGGTGKVHAAKLDVQKPFEAYSARNFEEQLLFSIFLEQENITLDEGSVKNFLWKYHDYEGLKFNEEMFQIIDNVAMEKATKAFVSEKDLHTAQKWHEEKNHLKINLKEYFMDHYDGLIVEKSIDNIDLWPFDQIGVLHSSQIHLIASEKDLQGFRDFMLHKEKQPIIMNEQT